MKIIVNDKIYIQKKDLELIFKSTNEGEIPPNIIGQYKKNTDIRDIDFMLFEDKKERDFLNDFWFVIDYNDIIDFDELEIINYNFSNLQNLRKMRVEYEKNKYLPNGKVHNNFMDAFVDEFKYYTYIPSEEEAKKYPLDFQLLYNKILDVRELNAFKSGMSDLEVPEEIFKPVRYTNKQLQQIYYGVLCENLTFKELKPYEKQLYSIFSRINYTPEILRIIRKIMIINRYNSVDFINDDLLDLLLNIGGRKTKFDETGMFLMDYLYAIGYNKFENFESRVVLEKDLTMIKFTISFIAASPNLQDNYIDKLSNYNYTLAEILRVLKKCDHAQKDSRFVKDIFDNMAVFVYFNPSVIDHDYSFLEHVYDYIVENSSELINSMGYDISKTDIHNECFVENFNKANSLLINLYNQRNNKTSTTNNTKIIR